MYPPPLHENDSFLNFPLRKFEDKKQFHILDKIKLVFGWLPDVPMSLMPFFTRALQQIKIYLLFLAKALSFRAKISLTKKHGASRHSSPRPNFGGKAARGMNLHQG